AQRLDRTREREEYEERGHRGRGDDEVLDLLRTDAHAGAELPVATDRQRVATQVVAEDEAHHVFEDDREGDGGDRGGQRAGRTQGLENDLVVDHADRARDEERGQHRRRRGPAARGVRDVAG